MIRILSVVAMLLCVTNMVSAQEQSNARKAERTATTQKAVEELRSAIVGMQASASDLREKSVTGGTVAAQTDVITSLDRLIAMSSKIQSKGKSGSAQKEPAPNNSESPKESEQGGQEQQTSQSGEQRNTSEEPQDSTNSTQGIQSAGDGAAGKRRILVRDVWGHLPPAIQRRLMSVPDEKPIPRYQRLVERYFRAIAEQRVRKPTKRPSSPRK